MPLTKLEIIERNALQKLSIEALMDEVKPVLFEETKIGYQQLSLFLALLAFSPYQRSNTVKQKCVLKKLEKKMQL